MSVAKHPNGMATGSGTVPKLLKAAYLAQTEGLLKETRATALYYLPGPTIAVLFFGLLDYGALSAKYGLPPLPGATWFFQTFPLNVHNLGDDTIWTLLLGLILLICVLWLLYRYLRWISTVYAITTHRVIIQRGILSREFDEIPIPQVRGVDVRQTIFERMLRFGTVRVSSEGGVSSSIGNEDWKGIPRPFDFQRLIESASQAIARGAFNSPPPPSLPGFQAPMPPR
jgi:hypothetical protein